MSERPSRRLKNAVAGIFRPRTSPPSASGSVPSPAATIPVQVDNSAVLSPPTAHAPSIPPLGVTLPIPQVAVAPSESNLPGVGATSTSAKDTAFDNLALVLDITEKLAGFAQTIPFIAPAAGFLSQILKAYKEVKDTDHKRDALLDHITGISQDLCATVLRMEAINHIDLIGRLRPDIETYSRLLEETSKFVSEYDGLGGLRRGAARTQLGTRLSDLQQALALFGSRFRNNRLVDLAIQQNIIKETLDKVLDMALEKKLDEWLQSPPDMRQKQHETQKLRKEGTGCWFLEGTEFIEWQDNAGSLWIQGASGTGKSVLSSSVIQKLIDDQQLFADLGKSSAVAFFYFDFKAKGGNAVETALRRIVLQLSAQSPHPFRVLDKQYNLSRGQALPNYRDLQRILEELLHELGRVYLILDALDECPDFELAQLISLISMLQEWTRSPLHLLFTSQPRTTFTDAFTKVPCVSLGLEATQRDIELFITSELGENRHMKIWGCRIDEIVDRVVLKSNGMFRLAACFLFELSRCKRQNELDKTLENLPNDLFGIYDRFLEIIRQEDLVYVTGILRWLIFSTQNLNLIEIADAIAFDFSDPACYTYDPSMREDNANAIPEWLEGLTTVRDYDGRQMVVLAHASVQDYLLSGRFTAKFGYDLAQGPSHGFIAQSCISYLLYFADHPLDAETFPNYPLAEYVARRWCHHLLRSHDPSALSAQAIQLLEDGSNQHNILNDLRQYHSFRLLPFEDRIALTFDFAGSNRYSALNHLRNTPDVPTFQPGSYTQRSPLHLCSEEGYIEGLRWLLQKGADVNIQDEDGSPLHAASGRGHTEIVRLLLGNGADVNAVDRKARGTALQAACTENHTDVVRLLIASGANVNAKGTFLGTALQTASWVGNQEVVSLLLANGANINAQGKYFGSALQAASSHGNTEITRILLENGADSNRRGGNYGSALTAASMNGHADPVRLLLEYGADVNINAQNNLFGTPVQAVRRREYDEAARLLLAKGADVSARNEYLGSALQAACMNGHSEIVRFLLQNGANLNAQGWGGQSALQVASSSGHIEVIRLLLENGADVNAQNGGYGYALTAASENGYTEIVHLLLKNGADVNAQDGRALMTASRNGHTEVIRLLLKNGADIHANSGYSGTALHAASGSGHIDAVRLLLDQGGDVNANEDFRGSPLHMACENGHMRIIELLLSNGADVNADSKYNGAPLQAAARSGKMEIFSLLIQNGADVNARCSQSGSLATALQAVSFYNHAEAIRLLLENGADVNARGGDYGTALETAVYFGYKSSQEVVALLLANGADVNARGGKYGGALPRACKNGDTETVRLLLEHGADVNAQGGKYGNALAVACNEETVRLLLAHGADVNAGQDDGLHGAPLHTALVSGQTQIARLLLQNGARNARGGKYTGSALQAAAEAGELDLVQSLLANGADVNEEGGLRGTALRAASHRGHTEIVCCLLENGADVNAQGSRLRDGSALYDAAHQGHTEIVRLLLESCANVNVQGGFYGSALHGASWNGHTEIVRLLLARGADVNAHGGRSGTALQAASLNEQTEIIHLLLKNGADVNAQGGASGTALQAACSRGNADIVQLLLEKGADANVNAGDLGTVLQAACRNSHSEIVRLLIENGADIHAQGGVYGSALQAAATSGDSDLVRFLISKGADVNAHGGRYGSALGAALQRHHTTIIRLLRESGAEIDAQQVPSSDLDSGSWGAWDLQAPISVI